uniref:Uncharacterized protein n=1 Tax=Salix viminalis TaxID=40686 RepID=A0A6N2LH80_SALVM
MASFNVSSCPSTTTRASLSGSHSFSANGNAFNLAVIRLDGSKSSFDIKGASKTRATLISGDELLSYSNGNGVVASITNDFAIFNDNRQLDHPSEGL